MNSESQNVAAPVVQKEEGVDLLEILAFFVCQWKSIALFAIAGLAVGILASYIVTPKYEAMASLLPEESREEAASMEYIFTSRSPGDIYVGMLNSRVVQNRVVARTDFMKLFHQTKLEGAVGQLSGMTTIGINRYMFVTISVKDTDPNRAAKIANAYLDSLVEVKQEMELSHIVQRRQFLDVQVQKERDALTRAEEELKKTQVTTGLVMPESQMSMSLSAIAGVRNEITSREVQLAGLLQSETEQSPQVQRLRTEIGELQAKERTMEASSGLNFQSSTTNLPSTSLEDSRKLRDVKYHETVLEGLLKEYETVHLSEAYNPAEFQIMQRADTPTAKSWPPHMILQIIFTVLGLMMGFVFIILRHWLRKMQRDPVQAERLRSMRAAFYLGR